MNKLSKVGIVLDMRFVWERFIHDKLVDKETIEYLVIEGFRQLGIGVPSVCEKQFDISQYPELFYHLMTYLYRVYMTTRVCHFRYLEVIDVKVVDTTDMVFVQLTAIEGTR